MKLRFRLACFSLVLVLCLCSTLLTGCARKAPAFAELDFSSVDPDALIEVDSPTNLVKISVEGFGDVIVRLYPEVAPKTVKNFQSLVSQHFYDGLTFHRVVTDFMIQTGDPEGTGLGGSGQEIRGEFSVNGFENNLKHIKGTVSMARRGDDNNSASSQFFIVQKTSSSNSSALNGNYASFGYVVYGMEVVDAIAKVPVRNNASTNEKSVPITPVAISTIRFVKVQE